MVEKTKARPEFEFKQLCNRIWSNCDVEQPSMGLTMKRIKLVKFYKI